VWKFEGLRELPFQTVYGQRCNIEFVHNLLLNADVPLMPSNGRFDSHDVEIRFQVHCFERKGQRTTTISKRSGTPSGSSYYGHYYNHRGDEDQIWQYVDEKLNTLVQHFCEEYRDWKLIPAAEHGQGANDGMHHSGDSPHKTLQYEREQTGTKLLPEVDGDANHFSLHCMHAVMQWRAHLFNVLCYISIF